MKPAPLEVGAVQVGDLLLSAGRRSKPRGNLDHGGVVDVEARDRIPGPGPGWLLLETYDQTGAVDLDDSVSLRITDRIAEDLGSSLMCLDDSVEPDVAVEDVVAEDQSDRRLADEASAMRKASAMPRGSC